MAEQLFLDCLDTYMGLQVELLVLWLYELNTGTSRRILYPCNTRKKRMQYGTSPEVYGAT